MFSYTIINKTINTHPHHTAEPRPTVKITHTTDLLKSEVTLHNKTDKIYLTNSSGYDTVKRKGDLMKNICGIISQCLEKLAQRRTAALLEEGYKAMAKENRDFAKMTYEGRIGLGVTPISVTVLQSEIQELVELLARTQLPDVTYSDDMLHETVGEYHEHPWFSGQSHKAVWTHTWASGGTNYEMPPDAPVSCAVCGRRRE